MRYGEERKGYAIAIVVTEPWNLTKNVNPTATRGETLSQPSSSTLFVISRPVLRLPYDDERVCRTSAGS